MAQNHGEHRRFGRRTEAGCRNERGVVFGIGKVHISNFEEEWRYVSHEVHCHVQYLTL